MEFHLGWDFNFQSHTSIFVGGKFGGVSNRETSRSFNFDFELQSIDFSHALDFFKLECISIIETVSLVFM